ncbi:MAG: DUF1972 domain-containing protein [Solirubrobacteraceae bacterium]|nr:DUF1972 domain-containing protein [Solirubrobacteraceae bacterium]
MGSSPSLTVPRRRPGSLASASGLSFAILGSRGYPSTYGGYETLVRYLAPYMLEAGHSVTVYCRDLPEHGERVWWEDGVRCVATRGIETTQLSTLSFGASASAHAAFNRHDAVLILNIANGYWMPMLRAARVPFAVNTDGLEWKRAKWSRLGKAVFRVGASFSARLAPELVCDSRALGDIWQEQFGRRSTFIPYGGEVLEDLGSERIRDLGLSKRGYLLSVARLVPENNVELTLDAIERLGTSAPMAVVVGSANFDNPIVERLEALQDEGRVLWLGHVSDQDLLHELWHNAAVYVHGHSVGGTNPALLQALGAGAPTLALDTVFNREVLATSDHLYAHDADALAGRITEVFGSRDTQRSLIEHGRSVVSKRYSWDDVCRDYTDLLVQLAHARVA